MIGACWLAGAATPSGRPTGTRARRRSGQQRIQVLLRLSGRRHDRPGLGHRGLHGRQPRLQRGSPPRAPGNDRWPRSARRSGDLRVSPSGSRSRRRGWRAPATTSRTGPVTSTGVSEP